MNEDYWYYEEFSTSGVWIDVMAGYRMNRTEAIAKMETRKSEYPKAKLRLVHVTRERFSYRERNRKDQAR